MSRHVTLSTDPWSAEARSRWRPAAARPRDPHRWWRRSQWPPLCNNGVVFYIFFTCFLHLFVPFFTVSLHFFIILFGPFLQNKKWLMLHFATSSPHLSLSTLQHLWRQRRQGVGLGVCHARNQQDGAEQSPPRNEYQTEPSGVDFPNGTSGDTWTGDGTLPSTLPSTVLSTFSSFSHLSSPVHFLIRAASRRTLPPQCSTEAFQQILDRTPTWESMLQLQTCAATSSWNAKAAHNWTCLLMHVSGRSPLSWKKKITEIYKYIAYHSIA